MSRQTERKPNKQSIRPRSFRQFSKQMQTKLFVLFLIILLFIAFVFSNIIKINRDNGDRYKRRVLIQQTYDNSALPFRRGTITDSKGTVLASSTLVYNVIVDCSVLMDEATPIECIGETAKALHDIFGADAAEVASFVKTNESNKYYVVARNVEHSLKEKYDAYKAENPYLQGVWFEDRYKRTYPNGSLASDVIGFANTSNVGSYGLEEYYNATLNGTPGRSYGYISDATDVERTMIPAIDGNNLVLTLDANIQTIIEKYLGQFNAEHENKVRQGDGARNVGCIVMDCNTGGILGMASYPNFDLNDPYDTTPLIGMNKLDFENGDRPIAGEYLTEEELEELTDKEKSIYLNALWKNFCISDYYEPGSVAKPFTVAAGLDNQSFAPNQTYYCEGSLKVAEDRDPIKCHNTYGDGMLTVSEAIERSCNVALMEMAFAEGKQLFTKYQGIFGFGLKTNIDLANEARTDTLVYTADTMRITDLATNSFGQNFEVTMIEMAAGFCSLVNGGNYYQPHLVSKITSPSGATVKNIEPRIIKKTISEETSRYIRAFCEQVVVGEHGTGSTARPAGYSLGGKTGTAETLPRQNGEYVVSFMGFAPVDNPQVVIYAVVDRPNAFPQDDAKYATGIVRNCLTEILPYLNIPMTMPLTDKEKAELEELQQSGIIALGANAFDIKPEEPEEEPVSESESTVQPQATQEAPVRQPEAEEEHHEVDESWRSYPMDAASGYLINPSTNHYVDPRNGHEFDVGPADLEELENDTSNEE